MCELKRDPDKRAKPFTPETFFETEASDDEEDFDSEQTILAKLKLFAPVKDENNVILRPRKT